MNLTVLHEPLFEPVALASVYQQLRVDPDGSPPAHPLDDEFRRNITTARRWVEGETRRSLVRQTLSLSMPGFPAPNYSFARAFDRYAVRAIRLLRPPVIQVDSVKYFDDENVLRTLASADYYATDEQVPELRFVSAFVPPTTYDRPDAVRVNYVAGYLGAGSPPDTQAEYAEHVPSELKDAILIGVEMLQTSASPQEIEAMTKLRRALISQYIVLIT